MVSLCLGLCSDALWDAHPMAMNSMHGALGTEGSTQGSLKPLQQHPQLLCRSPQPLGLSQLLTAPQDTSGSISPILQHQ